MAPGAREYRRVDDDQGNPEEDDYLLYDGEEDDDHAEKEQEEEDEDNVFAEIRKKREELEEHEMTIEENKETLKLMGEHFESHKCELKDELRLRQKERTDKEAELEFIINPPVHCAPNPGPECLSWIQGDRFSLLATIIIVSNIATMVLELVDKANEKKFFYFDQSFMVFYVMELVVKGALLHCTMFFGKISVVWWNWLDSVIVFTGVLDMWVQPILVNAGLMQEGGSALKMMSFLRMLRLLRILKIIGLFLKADMSWTQDPPFQLFIMGVIAFNSILMSFESDIPDFFLWFYVEQVLLVIFSFEVACRLKFFGLEFFYHESDIAWNLLDFTIVAGGIVDMWMMPTIALIKQLIGMPASHGGSMGQIMTMLRMARLLRILRLVRLVKSIPPLFNLVVGIVQAFQGMVWVMVLTMLVFYVFSLLGVKLIGHGLIFTLQGVDPPPKVLMVFPSVMDSIFVLFKAMNGDWEALMPLLDALPASKVVLVLYTILSSWAILSILTAVVSENMLAAAEATQEEKAEEDAKRTEERSRVKLEELFERVDINQNNTLSESEFNMLIEDASSRLEFEDASDLTAEDLQHVFEFLSMDPGSISEPGVNSEPQISRATFVEGLREEHKEVKEKSFMKLEKLVYKISLLIEAMMEVDKMEEDKFVIEYGQEAQEDADHTAAMALRRKFSESKALTSDF